MKYAIIGALTGIIAAYLGASFLMLDFNAGNWGEDARLNCARLSVVIGGIFFVIGAAHGSAR